MNRKFIYSGNPDNLGTDEPFVGVMEEGPYSEPVDLNARTDIRKHATSFGWGYGGSGPAQLALAILAHHFAHHPNDLALVPPSDVAGWTNQRRERGMLGDFNTDAAAQSLHQDFKSAFVARWPQGNRWELRSAQITTWIEGVYPPLAVEAAKKIGAGK